MPSTHISSDYPTGGAANALQPNTPNEAVPVANSSGNVANATATATMPAVPGKTNYCSGFELTNGGATVPAAVVATLVGVLGGTLSWITGAGGAVGVPGSLVVVFEKPIAASAPNIALVLSMPALGAGNANAAATIHGYVV